MFYQLKSYVLSVVILLSLCSGVHAAVPAEGLDLKNEIPNDAQRVGMSWWPGEGMITQTAAASEAQLLLFGAEDWNDYTISAQVQLLKNSKGAEAGIVMQARGLKNYLAFSLVVRQGGACAAVRIQQSEEMNMVGDQSRLKDFDPSKWYTLKAEVHGVDVMCYLDGEPVASFTFDGEAPAYNSHGATWTKNPDHGKVGLIAIHSAANFKEVTVTPLSDFSSIVTPQKAKRDASEMLLPSHSYDETLRMMAEWLIHSEEYVDKAPKAPEAVRHLPVYVLNPFVSADDKLWDIWSEAAFNHALQISGCVAYYIYSGDDRILEVARKTADWQLENGTPKEFALSNLPPSVVAFREDGSWEGQDWGLELDKSAYMGYSMLQLYGVTKDERYLTRAREIAATLDRFQQEDGSWPFRVNAKTGEVKQGYAASQLWYVWFYDALAAATGDATHHEKAKRALDWLLENPVKTNKWIGLYGDVPSGAETYDQWVALETAMYLLERRDQYPNALEIAKGIEVFIHEKILEPYGFHEGVPGVVEQSKYRVVLSHHQMRLAEFYGMLYKVTGDEGYKRKAIETANSVTWVMMSDGKMRQGFWYHAQASVLVLMLAPQYMRLMACIPETAPAGETHLLTHSGLVQDLKYENGGIDYKTIGPSRDVLSLAKPERSVEVDGKPIEEGAAGWSKIGDSAAIVLEHPAGSVKVSTQVQ